MSQDLPRQPHEAPWPMWLGPLTMGLVTVVTPFVLPQAVDPLVGSAVTSVLNEETSVHLHLFEGINPPLILSVIAITAGALLYAGRRRLTAALQAGSEFNPDAVYLWSVNQGLPALASQMTRVLQNGRLRYYMLMALSALFVGVFAVIWLGRLNLVNDQVLAGLDWEATLVCVLLMIGAIAGTIVPTRLSAILVIGIEGALLALLFALFGAPDLAFTQFMIEVVTLVLFVLAFHFLPDPFHYRRPRFRRLIDVVFAAGIGLTVTVLLLVAGANRVGEPVSRWYIENAESIGQGHNVVNIILVDFRGLDTQGEIVVLVIAAMGVVALLRLRPPDQPRGLRVAQDMAEEPEDPGGGLVAHPKDTAKEELAGTQT